MTSATTVPDKMLLTPTLYANDTNKNGSKRMAHTAIGDNNRVYTAGSGIGTDSSMIAANDRHNLHILFAKPKANFTTSTSSSPAATSKAGEGGMDDEYGEMTSDGSTYYHPEPYTLENGQILENAQVRYMTYGTLNEERDNVIVVCHALTGNASLHSWWGDLLGPNQAFDTSRYFIVCANILGSCYGSTSPSSPKPSSEKEIYGMDFPDISIQDTVRMQLLLLRDELQVQSIKCVIGGSFGGMQAVEYAAQAGSVDSEFAVNDKHDQAKPFVRTVLPIACGASHTAWQIAISEVQRQAIYADPKWNNGNPSPDDPPLAGLSVARQIGMVSYRTSMGYEKKFGRKVRNAATDDDAPPPSYGSQAPWEVKSYLIYQGTKFLSRFDPVTYIKLTEQMDTHDVGRNRGGKEKALRNVHIPALVLGIDSDVLYPLHEQKELVSLFPNAELKVIHSEAGHDGFLLEQDQVASYITGFLEAHD